MYLTGAMAVQLTDALGFGTAGLGAAVALSRAAPAVASPYLGRLADVLGATRSIRSAALVAILAGLGVALFARSWLTFVGWLMLGGLAGALAQPAANRLLTVVVDTGRLGVAFGIKQSAPPAASMAAGLSVPAIALTVGWRWAFVASALFAGSIALAARPTAQRTETRRRARNEVRPKLADRRFLVTLAMAFGLATAFSAATTTFYVDAAVPAGTPLSTAGLFLAAGSLGAICTRVVAGFACDRMRRGHLRLCAVLIASACLGLGLLATGRPTPMAAGVLIALSGGWGFNGVFWYSLLRAYPASPGQVTGAIAPGGLTGGTLGPLGLGVVAERFGFPVMWRATAVLAALAATAIWYVARGLPTPTGEDAGAV